MEKVLIKIRDIFKNVVQYKYIWNNVIISLKITSRGNLVYFQNLLYISLGYFVIRCDFIITRPHIIYGKYPARNYPLKIATWYGRTACTCLKSCAKYNLRIIVLDVILGNWHAIHKNVPTDYVSLLSRFQKIVAL